MTTKMVARFDKHTVVSSSNRSSTSDHLEDHHLPCVLVSTSILPISVTLTSRCLFLSLGPSEAMPDAKEGCQPELRQGTPRRWDLAAFVSLLRPSPSSPCPRPRHLPSPEPHSLQHATVAPVASPRP
uniref:Predicted protein n=1 Tax=Hordeum vulgare subsp. vulgare TaxID=112509 RepID=F2DUZ0_HORVV|nr:predicted protein [Hordeum vulgare subsp. vulgare]